ncbi:MAG: hypothetical protein LWY06_05540 [Firmicutes bacterium]|nr:hypothetical protein [Bacillota bacterium]
MITAVAPQVLYAEEAKAVSGDVSQKAAISGDAFLSNFNYEAMRSPFDEFYARGQSLNGNWEVKAWFDGKGKRHEGYQPGKRFVKVPGHWITQGYFDVTGMVMVRKFKAGRKHFGCREFLQFGGSIYLTSVKLNGKPLTTVKGDKIVEGYFFPFKYDITDKLNYNGENELEAMVLCPDEKADDDLTTKNGGTGFPAWGANKRNIIGVLGYHDTKPGNAAHQKFNIGGIWQPVGIFTENEWVRIDGKPMANVTLLDGNKYDRRDAQVNFCFNLSNDSKKTANLNVMVKVKPLNFAGSGSDKVQFIKIIALKPGKHNVEVSGVIKDAKLWYPWFMGYPNLYSATVEIMEGKDMRCVRSLYFGVREISGEPKGKWLLNGQELRILGDNVIPSMTPGTYTKQDALRDAKLIIKANVQMVRIHAHVPHPYFSEVCDQMGILAWQDFPQQCVYQWDKEYSEKLMKQMREFVRVTLRPSVILVNIHNENKYFDGLNHWLPSLKRGIWMHASKPSEDLDKEAGKEIQSFFDNHFTESPSVKPRLEMFVTEETGAEFHPYYGYYYGEGVFDYWFRPSPQQNGVFRKYDVFDPAWGWREDAHPDPGVGALPSASYERVAGGGKFGEFGPDEFGFQGFSKYVADCAIRDVLKEDSPNLTGNELQNAIVKAEKEIPWGYLFKPDSLPSPEKRTAADKLYVKVIDKMVEHNLHTYAIPSWMKPEKAINKITLEDVIQASQEYQAWGTKITAEIYRRAGYGQTRFMFFSSEDDTGLFYSNDWAVVESNRNPKLAYKALKQSYQPILASGEMLSRKLIAGEKWINGLWLINDTRMSVQNGTIGIFVANSAGNEIISEKVPFSTDSFKINNLSSGLPDKFTITSDIKPGSYNVTLTVEDSAGKKLSENVYPVKILPSNLLSGSEAAKAEPILKERFRQLDSYYRNELKINPMEMKNWDSVVSVLDNAWDANWAIWKKQIEGNPEILFDYPEFTSRISPLFDAMLKMNGYKQKIDRYGWDPALKTKQNEIPALKAEYVKAEAEYKKVLENTKATLILNDADLKIIKGEQGARIPIPIFYGKDITTDQWFENLISDLEKAGAPQTADKIRLFYNNREGHWFDRELRVYKALKMSLGV